eukprot:7846064-Pyramimonas_sp.AAC.1
MGPRIVRTVRGNCIGGGCQAKTHHAGEKMIYDDGPKRFGGGGGGDGRGAGKQDMRRSALQVHNEDPTDMRKYNKTTASKNSFTLLFGWFKCLRIAPKACERRREDKRNPLQRNPKASKTAH